MSDASHPADAEKPSAPAATSGPAAADAAGAPSSSASAPKPRAWREVQDLTAAAAGLGGKDAHTMAQLTELRAMLQQLPAPHTPQALMQVIDKARLEEAALDERTRRADEALATASVSSTAEMQALYQKYSAARASLVATQAEKYEEKRLLSLAKEELERLRGERKAAEEEARSAKQRLQELLTAGQGGGGGGGSTSIAWVACVVDPVRHARLEPTAEALAEHYATRHMLFKPPATRGQELAIACPFHDLHWVAVGAARKTGVEGDQLYQAILKGIDTRDHLLRKCREHIDGNVDLKEPRCSSALALRESEGIAAVEAKVEVWLERVRRGLCTGRMCACMKAECPGFARAAGAGAGAGAGAAAGAAAGR